MRSTDTKVDVNSTPSPITGPSMNSGPSRPNMHPVKSVNDFVWSSTPQWHRQLLQNGTPLDILTKAKDSDTLVISFHGALDRKKYSIPRFERLSSLEDTKYNIMAIADPSLHLHRRLELAWYTGTYSLDLFPILADWINTVASLAAARKVVLTGSSGGGFAALQTATLVPNAVACVFNPQTAIHRYVHPNWGYAAQERYMRSVMPELGSSSKPSISENHDWTLPLEDRLSAVRRFSRRQTARVLYFTNTWDFHHNDHFHPFRDAFKRHSTQNLRAIEYQQAGGHPPPTREQFIKALEEAVDWASQDTTG